VRLEALIQGTFPNAGPGQAYSPDMAFPKRIRLSHGGAKNSSSKDGWWGFRDEAKRYATKAARITKRRVIARDSDEQ
jgi:hypothetical protein